MSSDGLLPHHEDRFWSKVQPTGFCWEWVGQINPYGYGVFATGQGKGGWYKVSAHRTAYTLLVGPIPEGMELDHVCKNRRCVNPDHLEPVTHAENQRRIRRPACRRGHLFAEHGRIDRRTGKPRCRACAKITQEAWRARQSV